MKICFKCKIEKPLSNYYVHKQMGDGHLNKCKDCTKSDTKSRTSVLLNDPIWVEKERDRGREKYHRLGYKDIVRENKDKEKANERSRKYAANNKDKRRESIVKYSEKYPEKKKATVIAQRIYPEIKGNHMHHWSYNQEHFKDVIELTPQRHATAHRFMKYDPERKMYRNLDGVLLDTKERHIEYIQQHYDKK